MPPQGFNSLLILIGFLIPGFVWSTVLSSLVPRRARAPQLRYLEFIALSCVNHGLWCWLLLLILRQSFVAAHPYWTAGFLFGIIFLSPVGLGLVTVWMRQMRAAARFLERLGFRTLQPEPTAWDWHFSRGKPYWVLVTLKDGSRVYGLYGLGSFAGDDPNERDLYLETQFRPTDTGEWAPMEDSGGVLIKGHEIAVIEFRKLTEVTYD